MALLPIVVPIPTFSPLYFPSLHLSLLSCLPVLFIYLALTLTLHSLALVLLSLPLSLFLLPHFLPTLLILSNLLTYLPKTLSSHSLTFTSSPSTSISASPSSFITYSPYPFLLSSSCITVPFHPPYIPRPSIPIPYLTSTLQQLS